MPNWVTNNLNISGDPAQIDALLAQLGRPHQIKSHRIIDGKYVEVDVISDSPFSFWNIVSPDDVDWYFENSNWYNWNVANWGTKWNANEVSIVREGEDKVSIHFDTAWSHPIEAIDTLALQYRMLRFSLDYQEEQGWGGEIVWEDGAGTQVEEYNIPESHTDYVTRGKPCWCEHTGVGEFDDCPPQKAEPTKEESK